MFPRVLIWISCILLLVVVDWCFWVFLIGEDFVVDGLCFKIDKGFGLL